MIRTFALATALALLAVPALAVLTVLAVAIGLLAFVGIAEEPGARVRDLIRAAAWLAVRRWYLSAVSLLVLAAQPRLLEARVRERTRELEELAFRDGQTGILNRRGFVAAHAEVADAGSYGLLLVDIDRFKSINDRHGHAAGDVVVLEVARRISSALGTKDSCARWGGDEFIVLLPECTTDQLRATAARVMAAIDERPIALGEGNAITVSVSVGACLAEAHDSLDVATDMADTALYMAKAQGRNMVVVFDAQLEMPARRNG